MYLTLDFISLLSLIAGINLLYIAALNWVEGAGDLTNQLFSALGVVGFWWAIMLGLAFSQWGVSWPALVQSSQLLSGFFGPLILLFTLSYLGIMQRFTWPYALLLVPGLAGSISFVLLLVLDPPIYRQVVTRFLANEGGFDIWYIGSDPAMGWYPWLQTIHAAQLLLNTLVAIGLYIRAAIGATRRSERRQIAMIASIYSTILLGIVLTNVLPPLGYPGWVARLAPVVPLPLFFLLWRIVRRRAATVERLTAEREQLRSYLPAPAVDMVLAHREGLVQRSRAAVLFSDLRDFTHLSELVTSEELIAWINRYFEAMGEQILIEQGMVDNFIGDAVLAVFGAIHPLEDPAPAALRAAVRMHAALSRINESIPLAGAQVRMGIGLHFGDLVTGSVGGATRRTYTSFGDTVNVASRISGCARDLQADLVISSQVYERIPADWQDEFTDQGIQMLRGRSSKIHLWSCANYRDLVLS